MKESMIPILSKEEAKNQVMSILADLYYDRQSMNWDQLKTMALVLYKYHDLGPKGTKEVALYLYKMYNMIKSNYEKMDAKYKKYVAQNKGKEIRPQELYVNKEGKPLSLGKMEEEPIYREDVYWSKKARDCIQDCNFLNDYIYKIFMQIYKRLANIKDERVLIAFKEQFIEQLKIDEKINKEDIKFETVIINYISHSKLEPEDIYRRIKLVNTFLDTYQEKQIRKEVSEEEIENFFKNDRMKLSEDLESKAKATLERLTALQEVTLDETCKRILDQEIFGFRMYLINGNVEIIQNEIERFENIFENATRKSRR